MWIHLVEIQRVIAVIVRCLEDRREHDGVETKFLDVVKLVDDSLQISSAKNVLTLWWRLPTSVESVDQQMIDSDVIKPYSVIHNCFCLKMIYGYKDKQLF